MLHSLEGFGEIKHGLRVLWRDELHIAIDKPTGLRSTPGLDTSATAANDGDADVELDTDAVPGATGGAHDGAVPSTPRASLLAVAVSRLAIGRCRCMRG